MCVSAFSDVAGQALCVGLGGFVGSVCRWGTGNALRGLAPGFPLGTLTANVAAGLIIGIVTGYDLASPLSPELRLLLATGLCGGLSTFSTFSSETLQLFQAGRYGLALANILLNVTTCLAGVWLGLRLGGMLAGGEV